MAATPTEPNLTTGTSLSHRQATTTKPSVPTPIAVMPTELTAATQVEQCQPIKQNSLKAEETMAATSTEPKPIPTKTIFPTLTALTRPTETLAPIAPTKNASSPTDPTPSAASR